MRIKLDENLPYALSNLLEELSHDADSVVDEDMVGSGDEALWRAVQVAGVSSLRKIWAFQTPGGIRQEVTLVF